MCCPNCRRETPSLLIKVDKRGRVSEGCHACLGAPRTVNVRTGKKVWAGSEVDGLEKNKEKIHAFGERLAARAAEHRKRHWRPSERPGA